jgi:hypothetical protein
VQPQPVGGGHKKICAVQILPAHNAVARAHPWSTLTH